jgi:hypothetical protein
VVVVPAWRNVFGPWITILIDVRFVAPQPGCDSIPRNWIVVRKDETRQIRAGRKLKPKGSSLSIAGAEDSHSEDKV